MRLASAVDRRDLVDVRHYRSLSEPDRHAAIALLEPLLPDALTGGRDGIMGFDDCQRIDARMCKLCAYATTHMMRDVSIATAEADNEQWCVHRFMGKVCTHCARAGRRQPSKHPDWSLAAGPCLP